jgi:hypothetical protein
LARGQWAQELRQLADERAAGLPLPALLDAGQVSSMTKSISSMSQARMASKVR